MVLTGNVSTKVIEKALPEVMPSWGRLRIGGARTAWTALLSRNRLLEMFGHDYRVDVTDPAGGFLPGVLDDSSLELQAKLDDGVCLSCGGQKIAPRICL